MDEERTIEEYRRSVGRDPRNLPDDHPDLWQWEYRGTKEQRAALAELLVEEEPAPVIDGQEAMEL